MGCYDIFCFICGNTCHSYDKSNIQYIEELYNQEKNKKVRNKYYEHIFKKIDADNKYIKNMYNFAKETFWLNNCTFLTNTNKVIHNCREVNCNIVFKDKKQNEYYQDIHHEIYTEIENKPKNGIFLHTDCWKFVKKNYKIELKYSDVPIIVAPRKYNKINEKIKYGNIEKYWSQIFKFEELFMDSNQYISISPLKDTKNALRIKKIISQFKLNQDVKRKGPSVSASFYAEKTIKYGINGLLWKKMNGKWMELKDSNEKRKIIIDNGKESNYLKKIVCYGLQTSIPIVIVNMKEMKNNKLELELQGTMNELNKLKLLSI
jgi:hypothetical protein